MRFLKLFRYDLRQGLVEKPLKWLIILALSAFFFFCFCLDIFHTFFHEVDGFGGINKLGLSFGDVLLTQTGGILPPNAESGIEAFTFPIKWLFLHALILYFTLEYMCNDLTRCGMQVMTRAGNKSRWWLSKCLWNITAVASYYVVFMGVLYVLSAFTGKSMSMKLNEMVFAAHFAESLPAWVASDADMFIALCVMPCAVGMALNLLQMTISLFVKPMVAFLILCAYLMAGVFYTHPIFLSNYALTVRSQAVGFYALTSSGGLILCATVALVAVAAGCIRIQTMDLIGQEG